MEPSCRVHDQQVTALGLVGGYGVVDHGRRVGTLLVPDHGHTGPLRPDAQLLRRRGPKGVRRGQHGLAAPGLVLMGYLADGSGLPHPVDAHDQDDASLLIQGERSLGSHPLGDELDERLPGLLSVLQLPLPDLAAQGLHQAR